MEQWTCHEKREELKKDTATEEWKKLITTGEETRQIGQKKVKAANS